MASKMVKVYRVVGESGRGMYAGNLYYQSCYCKARDNLHPLAATTHRQPGPYHDAALRDKWQALDDTEDYFFGFATLYQLKRWICKQAWRQAMHDNGGTIEVFEVPQEYTIRGDCQIVFKMVEARKVSNLRLDTLKAA